MNYKVLVVDDIEKNLQLVGNLLMEKGISILAANNGEKALLAAKKKLPDLILLDISMPEMDGYQVCQKLKANRSTSDIPVIFLTAKNEVDDIVKGFAYGAVDYVTKPFRKAELLSRVLTHLELKQAHNIIHEQKNKLEITNAQILEHSRKVEELNNELKEKNHELLELNATKDKFFSIISHDLKGPFSNILSFTNILTQNINTFSIEKTQQIMSLLNDSARNTFRLLENLLSWARSQSGTVTLNPVKIDLYELILETVQLLDETAKQKGITLNHNGFEEKYVLADKDMAQTILRNLISNALKFTPSGGNIDISCTKSKNTDFEFAEINVKDTGVGMDEDTLKSLFAVDSNRSTEGTAGEKGTGLGLILVKEFVEKNGGKISVTSTINEGSRFSYTLPVYVG